MQPSSLNQARTLSLDAGRFLVSPQLGSPDRLDRPRHASGMLRSASSAQPLAARYRQDDRHELAQAESTSPSSLRGTYWLQVLPADRENARYHLSATPTATPHPAARRANGFVNKVLKFTNAFRRKNDLQPLRFNRQLTAAAQQYCQTMATQDFFDHLGRDGSTPQLRGSAVGYVGGVGENIAAGYSTPKAVVQGWIRSPAHRANLLNSRYRDIGIGFYDYPTDSGSTNYRYYWAQNFGVPTA